ncbi:hypothetical protein [Anaerofustis stercorihominis]|uniref:hypothetical protein n=1 Tax=Anaerofustis stercorihominis TaxID=214853 RepID=UPI0026727DEB|nr:hypothetical protein [Anaerofustis stercorihominis]
MSNKLYLNKILSITSTNKIDYLYDEVFFVNYFIFRLKNYNMADKVLIEKYKKNGDIENLYSYFIVSNKDNKKLFPRYIIIIDRNGECGVHVYEDTFFMHDDKLHDNISLYRTIMKKIFEIFFRTKIKGV